MKDPNSSTFARGTSAAAYGLNPRGFGAHQALIALIRPGTRVLDVGCANGSLGAAIRSERNAVVIGVERDNAVLAQAATNLDEVLVGDVSTADTLAEIAARAPFDHVVLGEVLEHMVAPDVALQALIPMLRQGGTFAISLPNLLAVRARLRLLRGTWRYEDSGPFDRTHLRFFSIHGARDFVRSSGMTITREIVVGPISHRIGERGVWFTALRPGLLANQIIFEAVPTNREA